MSCNLKETYYLQTRNGRLEHVLGNVGEIIMMNLVVKLSTTTTGSFAVIEPLFTTDSVLCVA